MGKKEFIAFTEALAEIYNKVEECYVTINDFQKEIGFKKSEQFEINNLVYIIGNDILEERNLFAFYERHKFKFKKKLEHDFLLYIKMQNTVYMMHNKASSLGFLNKIWDKISVVDCKDATYENEKLRCLNADHIFLIYSLNKSNMRVVQMFDDENFKRKITVINESDLKDILWKLRSCRAPVPCRAKPSRAEPSREWDRTVPYHSVPYRTVPYRTVLF